MQIPEPLADRIKRVAAKVHARGLKVGQCAAESTVVAFENRYGISLPREYREFVLRIGNGAPGPPDYGLIELAEPPPGKGDYKSHTTDELVSMKKVFPFTKPWVWEDGAASNEGTPLRIERARW